MAPLYLVPCASMARATLSSELADGAQSWKHNPSTRGLNGWGDSTELIHPRGKAAQLQVGLRAHYILIAVLYSGCVC